MDYREKENEFLEFFIGGLRQKQYEVLDDERIIKKEKKKNEKEKKTS